MQLSVPTVKLKMQNVPTSSEILASHCIGSGGGRERGANWDKSFGFRFVFILGNIQGNRSVNNGKIAEVFSWENIRFKRFVICFKSGII